MFASKSARPKKIVTTILIVLSSVLGMQSGFATYYPSGPQQNVSERTLRDNGWKLFYEETYSTSLNNSITLIRPSGPYVILAGKAVGSSTILLAAAAPTSEVFTETLRNTPHLVNGTYWYYTPTPFNFNSTHSIGFSPTNVINQNTADTEDLTDPLRLSWHLWGGGWRLGEINGWNPASRLELTFDPAGSAYLKQVWTWDGKPVAASLRNSTNLQFNEAMYGSDTLSDPDGQLRKTIDSINAKYGNLISIK